MMINNQFFQILENVLEWDYYFANNGYEDKIYKGFDLQLLYFTGSWCGMISTIAFMKFIDKHIETKSSKSTQGGSSV